MQEVLKERARPRQMLPERVATPPTPQARLQPDADEDEEALLAQQLTVHIPVRSLASMHQATCRLYTHVCLCGTQQLIEHLECHLCAIQGRSAVVFVSHLEGKQGSNRTWRCLAKKPCCLASVGTASH